MDYIVDNRSILRITENSVDIRNNMDIFGVRDNSMSKEDVTLITDSLLNLINDSDTYSIENDSPGYLFRNEVKGSSVYVARHKILYSTLLADIGDTSNRCKVPAWILMDILNTWRSVFNLSKWKKSLGFENF